MTDKYTAPALRQSALLTIDVQQDFTLPRAPAEIPGTHDRVPAMRRVLDAYRQQGLPIIHVVRLYLAAGANVDLCRRQAIESGKPIALAGSQGSEIVDQLKPAPENKLDASLLLAGSLQQLGEREWALYKPRWDAFYGTQLEDHLRRLSVNTVAVVGCNFPNCPRATIYGASMRDFRVVMVSDAVSGVYDQGVRELNGIGVATPSTAEFLGWLADPAYC